MARISRQPEADTLKQAGEAFSQMFSGMKKVTVIAPGKLKLTTVATGKLVWVSGPNGEPPISAKLEDGEMEMEVYAAKIGGKWTLAR